MIKTSAANKCHKKPECAAKLLTFDQGKLYRVRKKGGEQMQAYCVKCKSKKEIKAPKAIKMKNGKPATQGTCPTCGTKVFRIGKT
jgi:hypothetical protein